MKWTLRHLLLLVFLLFTAACEPTEARAPSAQPRLMLETRWFLGTMLVRIPILKKLLAYSKAVDITGAATMPCPA
jgi:hypothetical protein